MLYVEYKTKNIIEMTNMSMRTILLKEKLFYYNNQGHRAYVYIENISENLVAFTYYCNKIVLKGMMAKMIYSLDKNIFSGSYQMIYGLSQPEKARILLEML